MYAEIAAAVQGARSLAELLKGAHALANYSEVLSAVHTVQQQLTDALATGLASQEKQAALAQQVRELQAQLAEVEGWNAVMQRYELFQFPATKALAYALKSGMENGEPMHYLCTTCADKKHKSTLQPNGRLLRCQTCSFNIAMTPSAPPPQGRSSFY